MSLEIISWLCNSKAKHLVSKTQSMSMANSSCDSRYHNAVGQTVIKKLGDYSTFNIPTAVSKENPLGLWIQGFPGELPEFQRDYSLLSNPQGSFWSNYRE